MVFLTPSLYGTPTVHTTNMVTTVEKNQTVIDIKPHFHLVPPPLECLNCVLGIIETLLLGAGGVLLYKWGKNCVRIWKQRGARI